MRVAYPAGRRAPLIGVPAAPFRHRVLGPLAHGAAALGCALAILTVFTALALAAAPVHADRIVVPADERADLERTAFIGLSLDRACFTDAGLGPCPSRFAPHRSGLAPASAVVPREPASRMATMAVLGTALAGALSLVVVLWRHLAISIAPDARPRRRRRRRLSR